MKLRYMIEYTLENGQYKPIGVWIQGPGPGLDVVIEFLPGNQAAAEDADWVLNRLVEQGATSLPEDFLEYHLETMSPYIGTRGPIQTTEDYDTAEEAAAAVLERIRNAQGAVA